MAAKSSSAKDVGSPEAVALRLMDRIADAEKNGKVGAGDRRHDREYWLALYAECLEVTSGKRKSSAK